MQLSTTTAKRRNSSASGGSKKKRQKTSAFQKQQANVGASIRANVIEWKNVDIGSQLAIAASTSSFSTPVMLNQVGQGTGNNESYWKKDCNDKATTQMGKMARNREFQILSESWLSMTALQMEQHPQSPPFLSGNGISTPVNLSKHRPFSHPYGYISHVHNKE